VTRRIFIGALIGGALAVVPSLARRRAGTRFIDMCERMFAQMPESAPPKRMMTPLECGVQYTLASASS